MGLNLSKNLSEDAHYNEWTRIIERIYGEQAKHASDRLVFRYLRAIFLANQDLFKGKNRFIFEWMFSNYIDSALMLLRRELDKQKGTECLKNLLLDMKNHPQVITRMRYLSKWREEDLRDPFVRQYANKAFDSFYPRRDEGNTNADSLDPDLIQKDLDQLEDNTEQLRKLAEQTRAHRTPEASIKAEDWVFDDLHQAIINICDMMGKYYELLTLNAVAQENWEPTPSFDMLEVFTKPWFIDRRTVEQMLKEQKRSD